MTQKQENAHTKQAYEFIRKKILEGGYPPGRRLQTLVLAADIGVSRTPVRDALRQLQSEGLVEIRPRLGASVRSASIAEFKETCELRLALESYSAELAARNRTAEDIVAIQDALEMMEHLVATIRQEGESDELVQDLVAQDIGFHFAILKAGRNKLIRSEILRLHLLDQVVRMNIEKLIENAKPTVPDPDERRRWVLECHRKIFIAIQSRDAESARKAMYEHISDIIDRSILAMARMEKRLEAQNAEREVPHYAPYS